MFRQLFDPDSSTYSYLLGDRDSHEAILIDPVREQVGRDLDAIRDLKLNLIWIFETHVHADHITGAAVLQDRTGARTAIGARSGVTCASRHLEDQDVVNFGGQLIKVLATPGHTAGCLSFLWGDRLFTGDALMIDACGRTDFQEGDAGTLFDSIHNQILSLPDETLVYPAHDYQGRQVSSIGEQSALNPYISGINRESFIAAMKALQLPPPKKIQSALPANQQCGRVIG